MDNAWTKVQTAAREVKQSIEQGGNHPGLRHRLAVHLEECARAVRNMEWADSAEIGTRGLAGGRRAECYACPRSAGTSIWSAERIAGTNRRGHPSRSATPEHSVVTGGTAEARRHVLNTARETVRKWTAEIVKLEGTTLDASGPNAIWRAAADALRGPALDEDTAPLGRLLDTDDSADPGAVAILIHDLDALIARWRDRDDVWTLRHTLQNEPRIVLAGSCDQWPPPNTTGRDSGAYGSFAVQRLDK